MMNVYADFAQNFMAIPVVKVLKPKRSVCQRRNILYRSINAGRKALQAGTSHYLGQNFAKAFDVKFANAEGKQEYVWNLLGVSTRLMGALVDAF
jgi:prolyl-tRNA synthetase